MDSINEFIDVEQQEPVNRGVGVVSLLIKSCMGKQLKVSCSQPCRANPGKMIEFLLFSQLSAPYKSNGTPVLDSFSYS